MGERNNKNINKRHPVDCKEQTQHREILHFSHWVGTHPMRAPIASSFYLMWLHLQEALEATDLIMALLAIFTTLSQ